jgi:hypothetical protein
MWSVYRCRYRCELLLGSVCAGKRGEIKDMSSTIHLQVYGHSNYWLYLCATPGLVGCFQIKYLGLGDIKAQQGSSLQTGCSKRSVPLHRSVHRYLVNSLALVSTYWKHKPARHVWVSNSQDQTIKQISWFKGSFFSLKLWQFSGNCFYFAQ